MPCRANVFRGTDHQATVSWATVPGADARSGYFPVGLLSVWEVSVWATAREPWVKQDT